ncbi:hypothetical protein EV195_101110 [Tenacibaculum skagerrakense]|uniref:Subunit length determinant protein n=1 Tax=Tenacibaculum skagerrakense TaxID=186571 RepID=A0A4R2P255_9FLAO|nr:hypothetical protein [Tenacibaculum skagerrakense]TCP27951.1 hypothetical protein EV195_101110 [Tenacibaculum skagerrakense]
MSKQVKENEEVDLGSLFVIIGKGFNKLFTSIGNLFKKLFYILIEALLFLKSNIIKLGIAAIVAGLLGLFLEYKTGTKYESSIYVKPNFNSARQLYHNIQYYDDLVKQENFNSLSKIFNISEQEARSLKKFTISPVLNENDILTSFDDLIKSIDTASVKSYSYEKFKRNFTEFDYKTHQISVISLKNDIFSSLSVPIISSIINNDYFKNLKVNKKENLRRTDALLQKNLQQTDSLLELYKQVLLEEAKKVSGGTTIDLGQNNKSSDKELKLFDTSLRLNEKLIDVNDDLSEKSEVINIVSNFQPIGHKVREIEKNKGFQFALVGFGLMIIGLLLIKLNAYLESYKVKK